MNVRKTFTENSPQDTNMCVDIVTCPSGHGADHLLQKLSLSAGGLALLLQGSGVLHCLLQVSVLQLPQLSTGCLPVVPQPGGQRSDTLFKKTQKTNVYLKPTGHVCDVY